MDLFLSAHWLAAVLLGAALVLAAWFRRAPKGLLLAASLGLVALGGLALLPGWSVWLVAGAAVLLVVMFAVLVISGAWWPPLAWLGAAALAAGLGGLSLGPAERLLAAITHALATVEFVQPWWLLLLMLVPAVFLIARRSLNFRRHESLRPWLAASLRALLVTCVALALAEPRLPQANETTTVLFVLDRSLSIPEEFVDDPRVPGAQVDQRAARLREFINRAVEQRGPGHERDTAGLIVFGRSPRLELPPSDAPRFQLRDLPRAADGGYTDIAGALKLALASFPEGTGKRIVLLSDGNENLGNAEEQARVAQSLGVQIDIVPLAAGERNEDEVLVERVEAPALIEQGAEVPIRVLVRSFNPNIVIGRLTLRQITEGAVAQVGEPLPVKLRPGLNSFAFKRPLTAEQRSYTYEAEFVPERVEDDAGRVLHQGRPPRDRVQNNRASTHVVARGQRRVLVLEGKDGDHQELVDRLVAAGNQKFKVVAAPVSVLDRYPDRDKLAVFLSNFDCLLLANVAADQVTEEQQEMLRRNTHDQGCGLVMIGGPDSFGAGGWQNTPVEAALPVNGDINSLKVQGKGGLVLIMHASEMADGNMWQKKIAKLAIERLGPADEVGVIDFDFTHKWHIDMQQVRDQRAKLLGLVDKMQPGDMPDFDPALQMALGALTDPKRDLATKHVIVISDGDPMQQDPKLLPLMKKAKITVTTVGVACHGANEDMKMAAIARATGGRPYSVKNPNQLPAIYIKETRLVSQSFVYEKPFRPLVVFRSGPTDNLPDPLQPLHGFVRTTPKPSPLVEVPILTPRIADEDYPVLAYWHYGLGKGVAFTSDAGSPRFWSRDWVAGGTYGRFWEQVIDWSLRPVESKRLNLATEYRDGKVRIVVDARTDKGEPDVNLRLRAGVTPPGGKAEGGRKQDLQFAQKNSGQYELEVKAEESGSYFITAQATRTVKIKGKDGVEREVEEGVDSVRTGVTVPYSPEFADLESNTALLERLREITGGQRYDDNIVALAAAAKSGTVFRPAPAGVKSQQPLWHWLLFAAGICLLGDVSARRLALDPKELTARAARVWARLRGRLAPPPPQGEFLERLKARKEQVGEGLGRGMQRFEPERTASAPSAASVETPLQPSMPRPPSPPVSPPAPEPAADDFAARLMKAKKKVWEEREQSSDGEPGDVHE